MTYRERLDAMIKIDAEWVPAGNDAAGIKTRVVNSLLVERCPGSFFTGTPGYRGARRGSLACSECWDTEEPATGAPK